MKKNLVIQAMLGLGLVPAASLAEFELSWFTIDGGGAMASGNAAFELSGTIGQPDAGALAGGTYTLEGGFWAYPDSGAIPGDCDGDGDVDYADFANLPDCVGGPTESYSGGCACFDLDFNGVVDLHDFAAFQRVHGL